MRKKEKEDICRSGFSRIGLTIMLPFIILVVSYVAYKLFFIPDPVVGGTEAFDLLPLDKTISLQGENLQSIEISIYQDNKRIVLLTETPERQEKNYQLQIKPKDLGLTDGKALTVIKAKSGILKDVTYEVQTLIDTVPPSLDILRAPPYIDRGSGGFAIIRTRGADSVFITLEEKTFTAFKVSPDKQSRPDSPNAKVKNRAPKVSGTNYYVFFPAPFDIKEDSLFVAVARDAAGNQKVQALPTRLKMKKYRSSSIRITDSFINQVVAPLLNEIQISDPEGAFKKVNEEWREESQKRLIDISRNTASKMLWDGRFLQLRNSKVMATYGDERTYVYGEEKISKSFHLGYDLASHSRAPVGAANSGIVRHAGDLSIYGGTVIIDHGLGLMSLYGHLSEVAVQSDQTVQKGDIIGRTGATGLAGGDHLHFSLLIQGHEVSPLYWWDPFWIKVNVLDHLLGRNSK